MTQPTEGDTPTAPPGPAEPLPPTEPLSPTEPTEPLPPTEPTEPLEWSSLFGSVDRGTFLARDWERAPLLIRGRGGLSRRLMGLDDVETVLAGADTNLLTEYGTVIAVRSDEGRTVEYPLRDGSGRLRLAAVFDAFAEGFTIVANHIARYWAPAAELCALLESELGHPVGCNLFLTPPEAVGFVPHYDAMDTFFVQIHGAKRWSVHTPVVELPFGSAFDKPRPESLGAPELDEELEPGDVLYLPRGWVHCGRTSDQPSLHLTFGVSPMRWMDLLVERLRQIAGDDVSLRRAVPPELLADPDGEAISARADRLMRSLLERPDFHAYSEVLYDKVVRRPSPRDPHLRRVLGTGEITVDSTVRRRGGMRPVLLPTAEGTRLGFPGSSIAGPPQAQAAMRFIVENSVFRVGDLPGPMEDAARVELVKVGIRQGLLRPVTPEGS